MNAGAVFAKQLLKGFGCSDLDLSPFLKIKWERTDECLKKLHQLLQQYRLNSAVAEDDDHELSTLTDYLDKAESRQEVEDRMRQTLLDQLLHAEKDPTDEDLNDVTSIHSIADVDDDSFINSIDDLDNSVIENHEDQMALLHLSEDCYHRVMLKSLYTMSSSKALSFVRDISNAMSDLCMRERERGVDSTETKQKTLILCWVVDLAPANIDQLPPDERLAQNVVVKLLNKKGKS